jgi:hypothetical protein
MKFDLKKPATFSEVITKDLVSVNREYKKRAV